MSTPAVALHTGRHGSADDRARSAAAGGVLVTACRAERGEERVHRASGGGVGAFVVDGVGEGEVALAERESDFDGVAVEDADLLIRLTRARLGGRLG